MVIKPLNKHRTRRDHLFYPSFLSIHLSRFELVVNVFKHLWEEGGGSKTTDFYFNNNHIVQNMDHSTMYEKVYGIGQIW